MSEPKKWWEKLLLFVIMPIFDWLKPIVLPLVKLLIENKFILLLAGVYIIFKEQIEKLFTVAIVEPFLSNCVSSPWNDKIFLVILLWAICLCVYRLYKRFYILGKGFLISMLLLVVWGHYRFYEHVWAFESFTFWNGLKYVDSIAAFLVGNLLVWISFYIENVSHLLTNITSCFERKTSSLKDLWNEYLKNKTRDNEPKGFCFDSPISKSDEDLLNRKELAIDVCKRIQNTANKDTSFAIGVTSEWGNGKTSFLNLIERNLDFDKNKKVVIHYNPWLNSDKKSSTLSFFDEMSAALKAYDSSLSNDILKYAKMLIDSSGGKYANLLNACLNLDATPTLRERFEEINKAIKRTKLQIIVFIDDLDRLYDSEILEVLSLIRNSANFSNTIFIVAYDRNYLVAALKKVNEYHPHLYLEKIFQLELPLPQFDRNIMSKLLFDKLSPYLSDVDKDELKRSLSIAIKQDIFIERCFNLHKIKTIRDLNRLINSFLASYDSLKGDVILSDLLNVELLRIKYPGVYSLLADNKGRYLKALKGPLELAKNKSSNKTELEIYLENNFAEAGLVDNKIQDSISYVYGVFPETAMYSEDESINFKSICHPIGINRYFHYQLLNSDISVVEFDKYRVLSNDEFQTQLKKWIEENKNSIGLIFDDINTFTSVEDYTKIIRAIFYCASLTYESKELDYSFDKDILMRKIDFDLVKSFYQDSFGKSEFESLIATIFRNQPSPYSFPSAFIIHLLDKIEPESWPFALSEKELREILLFYFDQYASSIDQVDHTFFWLYYKCIYKMRKNDDLAFKTHQNVRIINKETARRLPESYIKMCILKNQYGYSLMQNHLISAWGNYTYFEEFISSLDESNVKGITEFIEFYKRCRENKLSPISFDFKKFDLQNMPLFERE